MIEAELQLGGVQITQDLVVDESAVTEAAICSSLVTQLVGNVVDRKSALRTGASSRQGLRVHWAPDVYDPYPSMVSHTKGHRSTKPVLFSRRARRSQGSKGGHHGKHKKQGKGSDNGCSGLASKKSSPKATVVVTSRSDLEGVCHSDEARQVGFASCHEEDAVFPELVSTPASDDVEATEDVELQQSTAVVVDTHYVARKDMKSPENTAELLVTSDLSAPPAEVAEDASGFPSSLPPSAACYWGGMLKSAEGQRAGKKRVNHGSSKCVTSRAEQALVAEEQDVSKVTLEDISIKRLAGATALTSGDITLARELLLGALLQGRLIKAYSEQARCLRLLADTQPDDQRERSLVSAIECFLLTNLPFEHAEAMLCLAQHKVLGVLSQVHLQWNSWKWCRESLTLQACQVLRSSKTVLQEAAALLLSNQLAPSLFGNKVPMSMSLESPTGRRRKLKGQHVNSVELAAATVVMGSICEVWGKVCILLGEFDEAQAQLYAAAKNSLWCLDCPEEAALVHDLLESLLEDNALAGSTLRTCTVY